MILRRQKMIFVGAVLVCTAALATPASAAEPDCVAPLARAASDRGYRIAVQLDDTPVQSVVDAADAHADATGADVVLLRRGDRLHALAPGLGHATARRMARAAEASDDPVCTLATALAEHVARPRAQRPVLAGLFVACGLIAAAAARRAQKAK